MVFVASSSNCAPPRSSARANGALVVANAPDDRLEQVLRQLLIYSALIAIIGPIVVRLVFVVPGLV